MNRRAVEVFCPSCRTKLIVPIAEVVVTPSGVAFPCVVRCGEQWRIYADGAGRLALAAYGAGWSPVNGARIDRDEVDEFAWRTAEELTEAFFAEVDG